MRLIGVLMFAIISSQSINVYSHNKTTLAEQQKNNNDEVATEALFEVISNPDGRLIYFVAMGATAFFIVTIALSVPRIAANICTCELLGCVCGVQRCDLGYDHILLNERMQPLTVSAISCFVFEPMFEQVIDSVMKRLFVVSDDEKIND